MTDKKATVPSMTCDWRLYWRTQGRGRVGLFLRSTSGYVSAREPRPVGAVLRRNGDCIGFVNGQRICLVPFGDGGPHLYAWDAAKDFVRAKYLVQMLDSRIWVMEQRK